MQSVTLEAKFISQNVVYHGEPESAEYGQQRYYQKYARIAVVIGERAVWIARCAANVETRVAECGNRIEQRLPYSDRAVLDAKEWDKHERARRFYHGSHYHNVAYQTHYALSLIFSERLLYRHAVFERYAPAYQYKYERSERHEPEPAELYEYKKHCLTESRQLERGRFYDQPRTAYAVHCPKYGVGKRHPLAVRIRDGQSHKECADKHDGEKSQEHYERRFDAHALCSHCVFLFHDDII